MTTHPTPQLSPANHRGFTLIELLVVIAIIALLTSITIPIYRVVNEGTNSARSLANVKNIGSAISIYSAQNNNQHKSCSALVALSRSSRGLIGR